MIWVNTFLLNVERMQTGVKGKQRRISLLTISTVPLFPITQSATLKNGLGFYLPFCTHLRGIDILSGHVTLADSIYFLKGGI